MNLRGFALLAVGAFACKPAPSVAPVPAPVAPAPPAAQAPPLAVPQSAPAAAPDPVPVPDAATQPIMPPADALRAGWMPLAATGADGFRKAHAEWDGRGVLIAILDSGIDAGVAGLTTTTTGQPKLLDLRDFSGEGRIALARAERRGDSVLVAGRILRAPEGLTSAPLWAGTLAERPLGEPPAADVNGDGDADDRLPLLVTQLRNEWVLIADTDGDNSFADEEPVRDYLVARETLGWAPEGRPAPLTVAVNFAEPRACTGSACPAPTLDLFFDTSAHGTHVAGIAAGHDMYGVAGFDGVAPGAQVLGLKIADDAHGGVSTTGSMVNAMDYAIRFATARRLPLVMNMSFGVGNEVEGRARIDHMVDSILAAHPDVPMTISAGNDGPGLSTLGFPGSARRAISVGATMPHVFVGLPSGPDGIASFSSRGGELAAPDLITPGVAYSTVPRWSIGGEREGGTSMASPHAAGLVALLRSAVTADAPTLRQALMATARPVAGGAFVDQGAGVPDVNRAHAWLAARKPVPVFDVRRDNDRQDGIFLAKALSASDTVHRFRIRRADSKQSTQLSFRASEPWLRVPRVSSVGASPVSVGVSVNRAALQAPGVYTGVLTAWLADTGVGAVSYIPVTVVVPHPVAAVEIPSVPVAKGTRLRIPLSVEAGRAARIRLEAVSGAGGVASLHEPGGMPFRDVAQQAIGRGTEAAVFDITASEAIAGVYELVVEPPPAEGVTVRLSVHHAPVDFRANRDGNGVQVTLKGLEPQGAEVEPLVLLTGATSRWTISATGDERPRRRVVIPRWARAVRIDVTMERDQWHRFTDLGMTLFDTAGRQLGQQPLNYAFGRLEVQVPEAMRGQPADLVWFPGFADPADGKNGIWRLEVQARFYADSSVALERASPEPVAVEPGVTRTVRAPWRSPGWEETPEYTPLGALLIRSGADIFVREVILGSQLPAAKADGP